MLAYVRRGERSQAKVRAHTAAVQHVFTAVLRVAEKLFFYDTAITDNMVRLQQKEEGEKRGTPRAGKLDGQGGKEEVLKVWGMLYADHADTVSQSW